MQPPKILKRTKKRQLTLSLLVFFFAFAFGSYFLTQFISSEATQAAANRRAKGGSTAQSIRLRAGLSPERRATLGGDQSSLTNALAAYAQLTGRTLLSKQSRISEKLDDVLGRRFSHWGWVRRCPILTPVQLHNDGLYTAAEVKQRIEEVLQMNGIVIVPEGKKGFWALPVNSPPNEL